MAYKPIEIDRKNLTIMGVRFPDLETLNSTANAIGSNMFEGFEPTAKGIAIIRDYVTDKITIADVLQMAKNRMYG
jgi:putative transcriptional regulator